MLFNSLHFLIFFPITVALYYLIPQKLRLLFLFIASCVFYLVGTPLYIAVIFLSILIDYFAAYIIAKGKGNVRTLFLCVSLFANVGLLVLFKYFTFFDANITLAASLFGLHFTPSILSIGLPVGLSFHTFQGMSYIIEVYKKKYKPEKNILIYGLYVMFFPQLVAGPIERPQQLLKRFHILHEFNYTQARDGLRLMLWGMMKKVAVADRIAVFVDPVFKAPGSNNGISFIIATVLFAYQIYYDFSGYTDIARGAAAIFGYTLDINFNNPYTSTSIQDFWRRWHISLSSWFRDYLYIPLGGNRGKLWETIRNLLVTFVLCGLWHGASWHYVVWGVIHGCYLSIYHIKERILPKYVTRKIIALPITFLAVCFGWIFFRANTIADAITIIKTISFTPFSHMSWSAVVDSIFLSANKGEFLIVIFLIIVVEFFQIKKTVLISKFNTQPIYIRWGIYTLLIWIIILAGRFGETAFIYYSF